MPKRHNVLSAILYTCFAIMLVHNTYSQDVSQATPGDENQTADNAINQETGEASTQALPAQETEGGAQQPNSTGENTESQKNTQDPDQIVGSEYRGDVTQADMEAAREDIETDDIIPQEQEIVKLERPAVRAKRETYMDFNFEKKQLTEIVEDFARKQGLNILFPQGEERITQTVTFKQANRVPLSRAQRYIHLLLDLAGYQMAPHGSYYIITPKAERPEQQMRTPGTLYINVPPDELPQSQEEVQAVYSLANLRIPEKEGGNEPISQLLKNTLSHQKSYIFDPQSNSIIISDTAWNIASAMKILLSLDASESPEVLHSVQLYNSTAQRVAKLLNEKIIAQAQEGRGKEQQKLSTTQYFASNVHVVPDTRRNRLLLLGREEAINKLHNFVQEYIDAPQDSGQSILHVYELQYLDAKNFAEVLKKLVQPVGTRGQQAQKRAETGPTRYFEDVKIIAEPEEQAEAEVAQEGTQQRKRLTIGGNRLVIAARNDDWQRLREIIAELDKPQKQVIIEVMIADVSSTNLKQLGSQTRNPKIVDLPQDITLQASHLNNGPILNQSQTSLVGDLLRLLNGGSIANSLINTGVAPSESGAMLLSISDPYDANKIWSIFKVLDKYIESEVLSHPFLVTRDNVQAQAKSINIRRDTGELAEGASQSVSPTTQIQDFEAKLTVNVTPRVSSLERLNLQIDIDIQDFIGESLNKNTRKIVTNANMQTGQVLVLGGLSKTQETTGRQETPGLARLPVIGQFFQSQSQNNERTNLVVFLTPTIVEPKLRQGLHRYTNDKIEERYGEAQGNIFDNLYQPITRFFFNGLGDEVTPLDNYLDEVQYKQQQKEEIPNRFAYDPQYEIMTSAHENTQALQNRVHNEPNPLASDHAMCR